MDQHFHLMVQSVGAGVCIGLVVLLLSYGFAEIARYLHTVFTP